MKNVTLQYGIRDHFSMEVEGKYFSRHMSAMASEVLHSKSLIAAELGHRDMEIDRLKAELLLAKQEVLEHLSNAARWTWLVNYLIGSHTDKDDDIVACETVSQLRVLVDIAIATEGNANSREKRHEQNSNRITA